MNKKTVRDMDVSNKLVLLRVDFNVPKDASGAISDDSRIRAALPTIAYLMEQKARIIVCSHLGRPKGVDLKESLAPVAHRLSQLAKVPVPLAKDCIGPEVEIAVAALKPGNVMMLENLRFHPEEEKNDTAFAQALAKLADIYVNDAFGAAHRAHASTAGIARFLPGVAGFLMEKEVEFLGKALSNPDKPMAAIVGGAKVSDKIAMMEFLAEKVQVLLVGGGMVATFLQAKNMPVGASLVEPGMVEVASRLERMASDRGVTFLLPTDLVVADRFDANASSKTVSLTGTPDGWLIMDIGPETQERYAKELARCKTVLWNGPMGVFEMPRFAFGTKRIAHTLAGLSATTIVGGGSTAEAIYELGLADKISHVSTGGGASLEFLEGRTLPGVAALMDK
ncbi:MAG: phosphoglycerate kinase [Dehalococcoidia bacterium]|nr:phosphoglycerate kinase [Dehalococcoidia bacterium]